VKGALGIVQEEGPIIRRMAKRGKIRLCIASDTKPCSTSTRVAFLWVWLFHSQHLA